MRTCLGLNACGNSDVDESTADAETTLANEATEVGAKPLFAYDGTVAKPGAPFSVSYKIIGTPIVGSPVTIDLLVTSALGSEPVTVSYRINDASAMMFHEAQLARNRGGAMGHKLGHRHKAFLESHERAKSSTR